MRVALIYPEYTGIYGKYRPAARVGVLYPPLGLAYIAAVLEREGHRVSIVDMEAERLTAKGLEGRIKNIKPDVVGVSSTTPLHHEAMRIFEMVKGIDRGIATIAGGPHPTSLPKQTLKECRYINFVVYGEGEETFPELLGNIGRPSGVKGIAYKRGRLITQNPPRPMIENLDRIPYPARHLLKQDLYLWSVPGKGIRPVTTIMTTRGCPFRCAFCSQLVIFGHSMRFRSVENVIGEIREIVEKYGINYLVFHDDTLGLNKKRTYELCDRIREEGLGITWEGMTRANIVTRELLEKMMSAGLVRLSIGVESGNQNILDAARKGITLEQVRRAYRIADSLGLETRMSIIFGLPFETRESIRRTIDFMKSLRCYQAYVNIGTPFPGTEYYDMARKGYGGMHLLTDDWKEYRRWGNAVIEVNDLKKEDLIKLQKRALLEFYLRPRQIAYNLRRAGLKAAIKNGASFIRSFVHIGK